jgi:hypothetical protein
VFYGQEPPQLRNPTLRIIETFLSAVNAIQSIQTMERVPMITFDEAMVITEAFSNLNWQPYVGIYALETANQ